MTHHEKRDEVQRKADQQTESESEDQENVGVNAGVGPMDQVRTPSQAEGERETVEDDLEGGSAPPTAPSDAEDVWNTPSQAEGDRDTVERNLRQKEQKDRDQKKQ